MRNWKLRRKDDLIAGCACPKNPDGSLEQTCEVIGVKAGLLFVHPRGNGESCPVRIPLGVGWICRNGSRRELHARFML